MQLECRRPLRAHQHSTKRAVLAGLLLSIVGSASANSQTRIVKSTATNKPAIISGVLLGSDGKPLTRGDAVLWTIQSSDPDGITEVARVRADKAGKFSIASTYSGPVILWLNGTSHDQYQVPLVLGSSYNLQINARLQRVKYAAVFDSIKVVGDFNGFRNDTSARLLQKAANGVYSLDIPVRADTFAFSLLRVAQRGLQPGTSGDDHWFSGNSYRTVVRTNNGFAHVVFDPSRIARDTTSARIEFTGGYEARAARVSARIYSETFLNVMTEQAGKKTTPATWAPHIQLAIKELSTERTAAVREMLFFELLHLAVLGGEVPSRFGRMALTEIPPASRAWLTKESLGDGLPLIAQWVADSVTHLMRPVPMQSLTLSDSTRLRASATRLVARLDSMAARSDNEKSASQWAFLAVAASYGWLPQRANQILGRMQAEFPLRFSTKLALQAFGSQQKLRATAPLPPLNVGSVPDTTKRITNASLASKTLLIDFWATWCGPCREEMPVLHEAYKEFASRGLEILSVSADAGIAEIATYREKQWPMPWLHGWVAEGLDAQQFKDMDIFGVPRVVLVGPDGVILASGQELRGAALRATLERVLGRR